MPMNTAPAQAQTPALSWLFLFVYSIAFPCALIDARMMTRFYGKFAMLLADFTSKSFKFHPFSKKTWALDHPAPYNKSGPNLLSS